jgi:hypothetical protein
LLEAGWRNSGFETLLKDINEVDCEDVSGIDWLRMERNDFHYVMTVEFNDLLTVHHSISV